MNSVYWDKNKYISLMMFASLFFIVFFSHINNSVFDLDAILFEKNEIYNKYYWLLWGFILLNMFFPYGVFQNFDNKKYFPTLIATLPTYGLFIYSILYVNGYLIQYFVLFSLYLGACAAYVENKGEKYWLYFIYISLGFFIGISLFICGQKEINFILYIKELLVATLMFFLVKNKILLFLDENKKEQKSLFYIVGFIALNLIVNFVFFNSDIVNYTKILFILVFFSSVCLLYFTIRYKEKEIYKNYVLLLLVFLTYIELLLSNFSAIYIPIIAWAFGFLTNKNFRATAILLAFILSSLLMIKNFNEMYYLYNSKFLIGSCLIIFAWVLNKQTLIENKNIEILSKQEKKLIFKKINLIFLFLFVFLTTTIFYSGSYLIKSYKSQNQSIIKELSKNILNHIDYPILKIESYANWLAVIMEKNNEKIDNKKIEEISNYIKDDIGDFFEFSWVSLDEIKSKNIDEETLKYTRKYGVSTWSSHFDKAEKNYRLDYFVPIYSNKTKIEDNFVGLISLSINFKDLLGREFSSNIKKEMLFKDVFIWISNKNNDQLIWSSNGIKNQKIDLNDGYLSFKKLGTKNSQKYDIIVAVKELNAYKNLNDLFILELSIIFSFILGLIIKDYLNIKNLNNLSVKKYYEQKIRADKLTLETNELIHNISIEMLPIGILKLKKEKFKKDFTVDSFNKEYLNLFEIEGENLKFSHWNPNDLFEIETEYEEAFWGDFKYLIPNTEIKTSATRLKNNGDKIYLSINIKIIEDYLDENKSVFILTFADQSEVRKLQKEMEVILNTINIGISQEKVDKFLNRIGELEFYNSALNQVFKVSENEDLNSLSFKDIFGKEAEEKFLKERKEHFEKNSSVFSTKIKGINKYNKEVNLLVEVSLYKGHDGWYHIIHVFTNF